jgi:ribokinase
VTDLTSRSGGLPKPGQTLIGTSFRMGPGGKGSNQAVAAHRAGADVTLVTKLGDDIFGKAALKFYTEEGMDTGYIFTDPQNETGAALIMVDEQTAQNEIVVVSGACGNFTETDIERARPLIESAKYLLLQLEVNFDALYRVIGIAHRAGVTIVLNPAPAASLPKEVLRKVDIIAPNETEAMTMTGVAIKGPQDAQLAAQAFFDMGVRKVVITLGNMGAFASDGRKSEIVPRIAVDAVDTTGAGDAFLGGFITALSEGHELFSALRFGNATGALSVTKKGTAPAMPRRNEIEALMQKTYGM